MRFRTAQGRSNGAEETAADVVRQIFGDGDVEIRDYAVKYSRAVRTSGMLDFSLDS